MWRRRDGGVLEGGLQRLVVAEGSRCDHVVDPGDVHLDDAARANVEVADLGVAELAVGQADEMAVGTDLGTRILPPKPPEVRLVRAIATALLAGSGLWATPSMMVRTTGLGRAISSVIIATGPLAPIGIAASQGQRGGRQGDDAAVWAARAACSLFEAAVGIAEQPEPVVRDQRTAGLAAKASLEGLEGRRDVQAGLGEPQRDGPPYG